MRATAEASLCRSLVWHLGYHLISALVGTLHLGLLVYLWIFWGPTNFLALALALLFFEVFTYATITLYLAERRKVQLLLIGQHYRDRCLSHQLDLQQLGQHLEALSHQLHDVEYRLFERWNQRWAAARLGQISARWFGEDVRSLREWILLAAVDCYVKLVRVDPLAHSPHDLLANVCIYLADLWLKPLDEGGTARGADSARNQMYLHLALEELKLIEDSGTRSPELYQQMAACYHRLDERERQVESYEAALKLDPKRDELRYQLGQLQFDMGHQRKGLEIYAHFRKKGDERAAQLLEHYGAQRLLALNLPFETL